MHRKLGEYDVARSLHERALAIERRQVEPNPLRIARSQGYLGNVHLALGERVLAEEHCRAALAAELELLGKQLAADRRFGAHVQGEEGELHDCVTGHDSAASFSVSESMSSCHIALSRAPTRSSMMRR